MVPFTIAIISDCQDENAKGRLVTRCAALFRVVPHFISITSEIEAAGNLVDIVDAYGEAPGIILMNPAPRGKYTECWPDGAPFCRVTVGATEIFTAVNGCSLSLLQKLTGTLTVNVFETARVLEQMSTPRSKQAVMNSQFRSYEFLPYLARAVLLEKLELPTASYWEVPVMPGVVWWVDHFGTKNFGNLKTSLLPEDIGFTPGTSITLEFGENIKKLHCYSSFKDIPDGDCGVIVGSSGIKDKRLLEIVLKGGNASLALGLGSGDTITLSHP